MSFGYRDDDWVNPDPEPELPCELCVSYNPCPCGCGQGFCTTFNEWMFGEEFADCGHGKFVL